jgi:hypothetical protein
MVQQHIKQQFQDAQTNNKIFYSAITLINIIYTIFYFATSTFHKNIQYKY